MATTTAPEKKKERPSALRSIIAGSTAGAVEIGMCFFPLIKELGSVGIVLSVLIAIAITYPAECTSALYLSIQSP
jgi:hypothetical protein